MGRSWRPTRATRRWRKLHKEELRDSYYSQNITSMIRYRNMRWAGHIEYTENRNAYIIFVGKPERNRPPGKPRCTWWQDDIKMDLKIQDRNTWTGVIWLKIKWRTLVNKVINFRAPYNASNFKTSWEPFSFSIRTLLHGVKTLFRKISIEIRDICWKVWIFI